MEDLTVPVATSRKNAIDLRQTEVPTCRHLLISLSLLQHPPVLERPRLFGICWRAFQVSWGSPFLVPLALHATTPSVILRADPLVMGLGAAQGKTDEELNTFFKTYAQV